MKSSLVTVGIPFFNAEKYLLDAVKSVLSQSYQNWELILIDDGSTDKSLEIACSIKDQRIKVISDGKNLRLPARLNQIIDLANGQYIARMDADDLCSPIRLEKQVSFLETYPDIDLVGTGIIYLSDKDEILGTKTMPIDHQNICKQPYRTFGLCHASIIARKDWYLKNKYNEKALQAEDFNLWLRSYEHSKFANVQEPLYYYRCETSTTFRKRLRCRTTSMKFLFAHYSKKKQFFHAFYYALLQLIKFLVSNLICLFFSKRKYIERRYLAISEQDKAKYEVELKTIKECSL